MGTLYERRLLNAESLEIRHSLSDTLGGIIATDDVNIELSNTDGFFNNQDLRGTVVDVTLFDREDGSNLPSFSGKIAEQVLTDDRIRLRLTGQELDTIQGLLPGRTVTTSLFPEAHVEQGLGKAIPVVFGTDVGPYPTPYVGDDIANNQYDYLLGEGTQFFNTAFYRDSIGDILSLVNSTEYTISSSIYAGVTVARFPLRQAKFGGGLHTLYAYTDGRTAEQNFARAIWTTLTDSVWGLNTSVDSASCSAAATRLDAIGLLSCNGVMWKQAPAIDVINQWLMVRGMTLSAVSSGVWSLTVDQTSSSIIYGATFGHGAGQPWNNVSEFGGLKRTSMQDLASTLVLDYAPDHRSGTMRLSVTRSVSTIGRERRIRNEFITNGATADKVIDYASKRLTTGDLKIHFVSGQDMRNLSVGDLFKYDAPRLGLSQQPFRIVSLSRKMDTTAVDAEAWTSAIYNYTQRTYPADITPPSETLWSATTPSPVTSLTIIGSGTVTDGQGGFTAFQTLRYNVPTSESYAQTFVRQRTSGNSQWLTVAVDQFTGVSLTTRIDGLVTGKVYDYRVSRVNMLTPSLAVNTDITSKAAPSDATAPGAPTTLAITDQHLKTITFQWTAPSDDDLAYYQWEIRTAASGGGSLVDSGDTEGPGAKVTLTLNQIAYSTTRYLRIRAVDWSGNVGSYSSSLSFSFTQIVTGDVGTDQITTPKIPDSNITTPKINDSAITTPKVTNNAITVGGYYSNDAGTAVGDTEIEIGTLTLSTDGGIVEVHGKADCLVDVAGGAGGNYTRMILRIRKDSTSGTQLDLGRAGIFAPAGVDGEIVVTCALVGYDASPATSQTYKLTAQRILGTGVCTATYRRLYPGNNKK
jgi:hypothetical protein